MSGVIELVGNLSEKARADKCLAEIQAILKRYNCVMGPVMTFKASGTQFGIEVNALPDVPNVMRVK
ncbi:MAG: hypothetical protein ABSG91_15270 [Syntrophobacteraceae bacterium]|jgi:hypothetical protein